MTNVHNPSVTITVAIDCDPEPVQPVQMMGTFDIRIDGAPLIRYTEGVGGERTGRFGDRVALETKHLLAAVRQLQSDDLARYECVTVATTGTSLRLAFERLSGNLCRLAFHTIREEPEHTPAPTAERGELATRDALVREAISCGEAIIAAAKEFNHDPDEPPLPAIRDHLDHLRG